MAYQTALSYQYLTTLNRVELIEIEELCIATQDTETLARIARIRSWASAANRTPVRRQAPAPAPEAQPEQPGFGGLYSL